MTTITLDAAGAAAFFSSLPSELTKAVVAAETKNIEAAERELIRNSSGTKSTKELAKAGYPFSRRRPNARYNPGIINEQTGAFKSGWHKEAPVVTQEGGDIVITSRVVNGDPKAKFMRGTNTMRPRPIIERSEAAISDPRDARLARAAQSAYQKASKK